MPAFLLRDTLRRDLVLYAAFPGNGQVTACVEDLYTRIFFRAIHHLSM